MNNVLSTQRVIVETPEILGIVDGSEYWTADSSDVA